MTRSREGEHWGDGIFDSTVGYVGFGGKMSRWAGILSCYFIPFSFLLMTALMEEYQDRHIRGDSSGFLSRSCLPSLCYSALFSC